MADGEIHFFLFNWSNTDCHKYSYHITYNYMEAEEND